MLDFLNVVWGLLKIFIGLGVVVVLAFLFTRLAAQRLPVPQGARGVRVLGHLYLGGRRGVSLVKVGSRILVLGVTDHGVSLLERVTDPDEVAAIEEASGVPLVSPDRLDRVRREFRRVFSERLSALGRGRGGAPGGGGPGGEDDA